MRKEYTKPVSHFIPLAHGIDAMQLADLSDIELSRIVHYCKGAEDKRIFQVVPDIIVREIDNQWLLVPTGKLAQKFNGMISLNYFSYFVWHQFEKPKSLGEVLKVAYQSFDDDNHMIDIQIRKLVDDFCNLGLLLMVK